MDSGHEQAIRQAAALSYHLAGIERALQVAEEMNEFRFLPETIRWHISQAETIAAMTWRAVGRSYAASIESRTTLQGRVCPTR